MGCPMFASRVLLLAISLLLSSLAVIPGLSNAEFAYFTSTDANKNCSNSGCHTSTTPPTCNGCHGHGTHESSAKNSMNLVATTDKASYALGDDISVKLTGGYKSSGWVRVNVYASNGTLLVSNSAECPHNASSYPASCDLPVTLKTRAQAGMTNLYVAWMGNEYDAANAAMGAPITSVIAVGKRAVLPARHVEEVVLTNMFSVAEAASPAPGGGGGGGGLDWVLLAGLIGGSFLRRKELQ